MIYVVVGTPGAGKTYYACRKAVEALEAGKVVVTNVPMVADWHRQVAYNHFVRRLIPGRRAALAARYAARVHYIERIPELFDIRLKGRGEGRGVAIIDEAHGSLNARLWSAEDRLEQVGWFSKHRHQGWDVYLITQDENNVDRQIRSLGEYLVRLKNLRRMKLAGMPLFPMNFFLAITTWLQSSTGSQKSVVRREAYRLAWQKDLYDTHGEAPELDEDAAGIWLPRSRPKGSDGPPAPNGWTGPVNLARGL